MLIYVSHSKLLILLLLLVIWQNIFVDFIFLFYLRYFISIYIIVSPLYLCSEYNNFSQIGVYFQIRSSYRNVIPISF